MVAIIDVSQKQTHPQVQERFHQEEVSIEDTFEAEKADMEESDDINSDEEDNIVLKSELEKIWLLLKGREDVELSVPSDKPMRKFYKSHQKFCKQELKKKREKQKEEEKDRDWEHYIPPNLKSKNKNLYYVGVEDAIKDEVKWRYGFQLIQETMEGSADKDEKKKKKWVIHKARSKESKPKSDTPKLTKL